MHLLAILGLAGSLQAADPFVGKWKLNVAKSKVSAPKLMPERETLKIETMDSGISYLYQGVQLNGVEYTIMYAVRYDEKEYPVKGFIDAISLKKNDALSIEYVNKKAGKEVGRGQLLISKDGKTLTDTLKGANPKGPQYSGIWVYDKK